VLKVTYSRALAYLSVSDASTYDTYYKDAKSHAYRKEKIKCWCLVGQEKKYVRETG
jgi:hypothetical protein